MTPPVWMVGDGGRTPFVGCFRGDRAFGAVRLAWAGRIAGTAGVVEGWDAAEAARDALADVAGPERPDALLASACAALAGLDPRWLARGDLSVLLVAMEAGRAWAVGAGLAGVWARAEGGWRPALPEGHPMLGEPGLPEGDPVALALAPPWVAVPAGLALPTGDLAAACGVRA